MKTNSTIKRAFFCFTILCGFSFAMADIGYINMTHPGGNHTLNTTLFTDSSLDYFNVALLFYGISDANGYAAVENTASSVLNLHRGLPVSASMAKKWWS